MRKEKLRFRKEGVQDLPSKLCCLGLLIILSWKHLRNSRYRKDFLIYPILPKNKTTKFPLRKVPSLPGREEHPYHQKTGSQHRNRSVQTNLLNTLIFPWFPRLLSPNHFPTTSCPSPNPLVKLFFTNLWYLCPRGLNASCSGHVLHLHFSVRALMHL